MSVHGMMPYTPLLRIAIIDFDDSYTRNLVTTIARLWSQSQPEANVDKLVQDYVAVLPHTTPLLSSELGVKDLVASVDALILSPGPGSPHLATDFGTGHRVLTALLQMQAEDQPPTLGVCLGHQGIAAELGATIRPAKFVRHGVRCPLYWSRPELPVATAAPPEAEAGTSSMAQTTPVATPPPRDIGINLFAGLEQGTEVVRYNSLTVDPDSLALSLNLEVTAWGLDVHEPDLVQPPPVKPAEKEVGGLTNDLDFAFNSAQLSSSASRLIRPQAEAVVLALRHTSRPLWGVQFHPESIDSEGGLLILGNFLRLAADHRQRSTGSPTSTLLSPPPLSPHLIEAAQASLGPAERIRSPLGTQALDLKVELASVLLSDLYSRSDPQDVYNTLFRPQVSRYSPGFDAIWLDSAAPVGHGTDPQWSFMAVPHCWLTYRRPHPCQVGGGTVTVVMPQGQQQDFALQEGEDWWSIVDAIQREFAHVVPSKVNWEAPFKGGLVGYFGYGMRYESILAPRSRDDPPLNRAGRSEPDSELALCLKVVAHNHPTGDWTAHAHSVQELQQPSHDSTASRILFHALRSGTNSGQWLENTYRTFRKLQLSLCATHATSLGDPSALADRALPPLLPEDSPQAYSAKVQACRSLIAAGESYELCLTTRLRGYLQPIPSPGQEQSAHWGVYKRLRNRNPAPWGAYVPLPTLRLDGKVRTIACSSPERFLSVSASGQVTMKPIKGTLPRAGYGLGEERYRDLPSNSPEQREDKHRWREKIDQTRIRQLSRDRKERAENLMIVDLIRADLEAHCVAGSVEVPNLMQVESYARVHQLVTTVTGQLHSVPSVPTAASPADPTPDHYVGVGATLRQGFPPGSMTGAPKRRSVQLLEHLESAGRQSFGAPEERGVYAGVLGWMDFRGAADFAVVIRTAVMSGSEVTLGAGGAITFASDPEREWNELLHKARSVAPVFLEGEEAEDE